MKRTHYEVRYTMHDGTESVQFSHEVLGVVREWRSTLMMPARIVKVTTEDVPLKAKRVRR